MKRESSRVSIPGLVEALEQAGASFRQTSGGCWLLEHGSTLPGWLADAFFQADERALAAHLRATMGGGLGKVERAEAFAATVTA